MGCCCGKKQQNVVPQTKYSITPQPTKLTTRPYSPRKGYTHIGVTKTDPLLLIRGFEKEPLVPLDEALQPFHNEIDQLAYYIKDAKARCKQSSEHGLTKDESAAIFIYTNHWSDGCLYNHLDQAWKSKDSAKMRSWFKFLRLFKSGYDKLPKAPKTVYQGGPYNESVKNQLISETDPLYSAMCLCSLSETEVMQHLNRHGNIKMMLIAYSAEICKLALGYTADSSNPILVWPGMKLGTTNCQVIDSKGSLVIHLSKKTDPPKPEPKILKSREKHFVCPNTYCSYRCRGNHKEGHCSGFNRMDHECGHHCGEEQTCKREAETFCYHCSRDVCTKHYLEHKKEIQDQLPAFVDEINLFYEQLKHKHTNSFEQIPKSYIKARDQLNNWRAECYQHIDTVYGKALDQITSLVKNYQNEQNQKSTDNLESLKKIQQQLKEDDVTYQQLQKMKQQSEKIKQSE